MTDTFPFCPEKLERLTELSRAINARVALAPVAEPLEIYADGFAGVPTPEGFTAAMRVHPGLQLAWSPQRAQGGVLLMLFGGVVASGELVDGVVAILTTDGLRRLAADLLSVADQSS